jgi:hypothetical protein
MGKLPVSLRFEQQRFYNPHHHPEMPRTLQLPGRTVGLGKDYSRMHYDQAVLCLSTSDPGSIGDTFEREDLLRSVE